MKGLFAADGALFLGQESDFKRPRNPPGDVSLYAEDILHRAIVLPGPKVRLALYVDQLDENASLVFRLLRAPLDDAPYAKFSPDLVCAMTSRPETCESV